MMHVDYISNIKREYKVGIKKNDYHVIDWYEFIYLYINFFLLSAYVSIFAWEFYQINMGGCQTKTYTMTM